MIKRRVSLLRIISAFFFMPSVFFAAVAPTEITAPGVVGAPGIYILANDIPGTITVSANDVQIDLNSYVIESISISSGFDNILIKNGTVQGLSPAISAANATNIFLENVRANNATDYGIHFDAITGGIIKNSSVSRNNTGIFLENSDKIIIDNCVAECNTNAGFSLVSSSTNCFKDCKALSTGDGNNEILNQEIFGFVSSGGHSNIFERCIANSTQALSATDSQSIVAGFALRGDESCTKIIECESANAQTNIGGVTIPYGILIEGTLNDPIITVTSAAPGGDADVQVYSVAWSPDGNYLAVGIESSISINDLYLYEFDRVNRTLTQLGNGYAPGNMGVLVNAVAWSPDGNYLAVGIRSNDANADLYLYEFDRLSKSLIQQDSETLVSDTNGVAASLSWSPDGNFLAVGAFSNDADPDLYLYEFNRVSQALNQLNSYSLLGTNVVVYSVAWSPDGNYLAAGIASNDANPDLYLYEFNRSSKTLNELNSYSLPGTTALSVYSVAWSPGGNYLAVGIGSGNTSPDLYIYEFDGVSKNLIQRGSGYSPGGDLTVRTRSVEWSPDGNYLAVGIFSGLDATPDLYLYEFDRGLKLLMPPLGMGYSPGGNTISEIFSVAWSPDGRYLALGLDSMDTIDDVWIFDALSFPSKNVIINNIVYCNSGGNCPSGVGISGSSIQNLIIGNTAYSNPIPRGANAPIVGSNYQFVTNVFNQLFGQAPTDLQNISVDGCTPICAPEDVALLAKQIKYQVSGIESNIDSIMDGLSVLQCGLVAINTATTITASGVYCLSNNISGSPAITITADDVTINLNDQLVDGGIVFTGRDNIQLFNGIVQADSNTDGISAQSSTNIRLSDVHIQNSSVGFNGDNIINGLIKNCSFTQNVTGLQLNESYNIAVRSCIATRNLNAGFDLINSSTNCFQDCKALSTGQNNNEILNQEIFGFVSTDGHSNIFEGCIANATQALSTTDSNSIVAGFALRGDESCTKIIDSEAANSTTSHNGVTIPYGILLEAQFEALVSVTDQSASDPLAASWSYDGKYIAVGIDGDDLVQIYRFDRVAESLTSVVNQSGNGANSFSWSPDDNYLAAGLGDDSLVQIYQFDSMSASLTPVANQSASTPGSVTWSPDGNYLAAVLILDGLVQVYKFDRVAEFLTPVANQSGGIPSSVDWSPDGRYLAAALQSDNLIQIYEFDKSGPSLIKITDQLPDIIDAPISVSWSPDGKYLAAGLIGDDLVKIYEFDRSSQELIALTSQPGNDPYSIDWTPDGKYLAVALGVDNIVRVYEFDRSSQALIALASQLGNVPVNVNWGPDGTYLAVAIFGDNVVKIYKAFTFPSKNVIKGNTVYCNSGGNCPSGVGISGSSIQNMIIGNTSYSNPIPQGANHPIVSSNYQFVTNVFNPLFGQAPTDLQNISLDGCTPICMPEDEILLLKQIQYALTACAPIAISVSSLPTTIATAGVYCLSEDVSGTIASPAITIAADNVTIDLNNHVIDVSGDVPISSSGFDTITIKNGRIDGSSGLDGISISSAQNIKVSNVVISNCLVGVNFTNVQDSAIEYCSFTQNTTGLQLTSCGQITVDHCSASRNLNAGYDLIGTGTSCIRDSKAVSTGANNNEILNQTIFGFVSANGYGNIFERCIANATQALSTTDSQSIVAGFALRGDEGCTKIIECESANATTSPDGVTVPYGILLETQFDGLVSVTAGSPDPDGSQTVYSVSWSPDGKYLAVGTNSLELDDDLYLYEFDQSNKNLIKLAGYSPDPDGDQIVYSVSWSPDGKYLAVGTNSADPAYDDLYLYEFDQSNKNLIKLAEYSPDPNDTSQQVFSVSWSPNGKYLAVGTNSGDYDDDLYLYEFDQGSKSLIKLAGYSPSSSAGAAGQAVYSVSWSPDGKYLAVGINSNNVDDDLYLYEFDQASKSLIKLAGYSPDPNDNNQEVRSVSWSPDGKYLAVGTNSLDPDDDLYLYEFDQGSKSLIKLAGYSPSSSVNPIVYSVSWSPDGKYLAVGINSADGNDDLYLYEFDQGSKSLIKLAGYKPDPDGSQEVRSVSWSPDGKYLAVGINSFNSGDNDLFIYQALTFPFKNVITNNTVYCNSGGLCPSGVGISGSSICNMIIGNTSYSNPIDPFMVSQNYIFVTNVFNQLFGQGPTDLQNISLGGCEPICMPCDPCLLVKQNLALLDEINSKIDVYIASLP